ncbi:MAG: DUF3877 family protein [Eubacteriales bacterium]|nr:DUF3877 family protein [Eubacteriales bacterium]
MDYTALETNLIDLIKEQQAKLGYRKEKVSLYYPLSTLNHFFKSNVNADEMQNILNDFAESVKDRFGEVKVSHKGERFCFHLSDTMSEYVHSTMKENEFIKELVELVSVYGTTMEQIVELFHAHSKHVVTEQIRDGEFDCMIRFEDHADDRYYYCFKDEGCHIIYHRFLPEDYKEFGY